MRPQFSLKWMLIAFSVFAVAFYVVFVRPTVIAQRFVAAIENRDSKTLEGSFTRAMHAGESIGQLGWNNEFVSLDEVSIDAELEPRTWGDVVRLQRRIHLSVSGGYTLGMSFHWGEQVELIAGLIDVTVVANQKTLYF